MKTLQDGRLTASSDDVRIRPLPMASRPSSSMAAERHRVALLGEPRDVSVARAFVRCLLRRVATAAGVDGAVLVVSELITLAVVSNAGPITLEVAAHRDRAILYLTYGRAAPHWIPAQREPTSTWMQVIERLTIDWWMETDDLHTMSTAVVALRPASGIT